MKGTLSSVLESILAALFLGGSFWVFVFGPSIVLHVVYGFLPVDLRMHMYAVFSPNSLDGSFLGQSFEALIMLLLGLYLAAGVWTSYTQHRWLIITPTLASLLYLVYVIATWKNRLF